MTQRHDSRSTPSMAGWPRIALTIAIAALAGGACKRSPALSAATAEATGDVPNGCVETNPPANTAAACTACLEKNAIDKPINDGCCGIRDTIGLQLCQAVSACMRAGGAPVGACNVAGDTTTCFCGNHQADCDVAGKADGPCINQIRAAAGRNVETRTTDTPDAAEILDRYGKASFALGRASNIAAIAGAFCKTECAIGM
jgi:hypothetical protein